MTSTTCCGLILVVALYMGVGHAFPTVIHTPEPGSGSVFPQVCGGAGADDGRRAGG
jgi:hypothetical protein